MSIYTQIIILISTYLLGSIPFGYILTLKLSGKNIRDYGSGNIGSTNVKRVAGKKLAIITQLLDMLKGLFPVLIFLLLYNNYQYNYDFVFLIAMASILGHDFSIFLKFKGGKGVNTTLGASLLLAPYSVLISVAVYFIVKWKTSYVSLGSIFIALFLPLLSFFLNGLNNLFYYLVTASLLIILLHHKNILRLIKGDENK